MKTILIFLFLICSMWSRGQDSTTYEIVGEGISFRTITAEDTARYYREGVLYATTYTKGDTLFHLAADTVSFMSVTDGGTRRDYYKQDGEWVHLYTVKTYRQGICTEGLPRCQAITQKGRQCLRNAKAGKKYCWQHLINH